MQVLCSKNVHLSLSLSLPRLELCLQQNEIMDLFLDDYLALSDTDGITGNKSDTNMKEYQSFTDLKFSKDKIITAIDWHPTIKGQGSLMITIIIKGQGVGYTVREKAFVCIEQ